MKPESYDVHVWVPNKRKRSRITGTMYEMVIQATSAERARESALHHHPGAQVRKCALAMFPAVLHLRSWNTED